MKHKQHDFKSTNVENDRTDRREAGDETAEADTPRAARATPAQTSQAADRPTPHAQPTTTATVEARSGSNGHLLDTEQRDKLRSRWEMVQASFVDHPRKSVSSADDLVKEATEAIHEVFENGRRKLESAWDQGDDVSTEELRLALKRYRFFFERVVSM